MIQGDKKTFKKNNHTKSKKSNLGEIMKKKHPINI